MSDSRFRFKNPKKQDQNTSVDGFVPKRRGQLNTPQYYGQAQVTGGPRRALKSRQVIPTETLEGPDEDIIKLGDFDQPESNIFEQTEGDGLKPKQRGRHKSGRNRGATDDKKAKKSRFGRLGSWWKNRSTKFKVGFISGIVLLVLAGLVGVRLFSFLNSVFGRGVGNGNSAALNDCSRLEDLKTEGDCRFNILLLGRGGEENQAPDLTDTIIVASIDLKNQTASMLSIPRDTFVGDKSDNGKINGVFSHAKNAALYKGESNTKAEDAGVKAIIGTARDISGVPIHKYVLTDYKAFRDVVNALGGVTIWVPERIDDYFANWHFDKGKQKMSGARALQYARTRHGNLRGDFDRNENQRRLLLAMRSKATSTGIVANPVKLNSLANAVQKNIRTDLSITEAKALFERTKNLPADNIKSLDLAKPDGPLVTTGMAYGQSIVRPVDGLQDYTKIKAYARSNMIDPFLRSEAPNIAVYNATGKTGLATSVGDVLAGYGYKVLDKETSKSAQAKTVVVKINKKAKMPFTERFLGLRFKTVITADLPSGVVPASKLPKENSDSSASTTPQPDYIIILGANFKTPVGPTW